MIVQGVRRSISKSAVHFLGKKEPSSVAWFASIDTILGLCARKSRQKEERDALKSSHVLSTLDEQVDAPRQTTNVRNERKWHRANEHLLVAATCDRFVDRIELALNMIDWIVRVTTAIRYERFVQNLPPFPSTLYRCCLHQTNAKHDEYKCTYYE